jgi:hypothetical protein
MKKQAATSSAIDRDDETAAAGAAGGSVVGTVVGTMAGGPESTISLHAQPVSDGRPAIPAGSDVDEIADLPNIPTAAIGGGIGH